MAFILGKPFLEHQIMFLKENGINEIILAVHHHANKIKSYFGDGRIWKVNITYSEEEVPLGTGGAIKHAEKHLNERFLVLNGDSYSDIDLKDLVEFHKNKGSIATMSLTKANNNEHFGNVILKEDKIIEFVEKNEKNYDSISDSLINIGVYIFEPKIFNYIEKDKNVSLEYEIFSKLTKENLLIGYKHEGYFMDIGRPETYQKFKKDILKTLFLKKNNTIRDALNKIDKNCINIILIVDDEEKLCGVVNGRIAKDHLLKGGNIEDFLETIMIKDPITAKVSDPPDKIKDLLIS